MNNVIKFGATNKAKNIEVERYKLFFEWYVLSRKIMFDNLTKGNKTEFNKANCKYNLDQIETFEGIYQFHIKDPSNLNYEYVTRKEELINLNNHCSELRLCYSGLFEKFYAENFIFNPSIKSRVLIKSLYENLEDLVKLRDLTESYLLTKVDISDYENPFECKFQLDYIKTLYELIIEGGYVLSPMEEKVINQFVNDYFGLFYITPYRTVVESFSEEPYYDKIVLARVHKLSMQEMVGCIDDTFDFAKENKLFTKRK